MRETGKEEYRRQLRELEGKNIAHYQVLLEAWIATRMERDKAIVALSAAATGLLVTILTTVGVGASWELFLYFGAFSAFVISIWSSLEIYQLNSEHIEQAIRGSEERDPRLEKYDKKSRGAFLIGIIFSAAIGLAAAFNAVLRDGDRSMTNEDQNRMGRTERTKELDSSGTLKKSVDGITNLSPQKVQTPSSTPKPSSGSSGSSNSSGSSSSQSKKSE